MHPNGDIDEARRLLLHAQQILEDVRRTEFEDFDLRSPAAVTRSVKAGVTEGLYALVTAAGATLA